MHRVVAALLALLCAAPAAAQQSWGHWTPGAGAFGHWSWGPYVANIAALPTCNADTDAWVRAVRDTGSGSPGVYQCESGVGWAAVGGGGGVADHGALTGLADDDHTGYALLAGRGTNQLLQGGLTSDGSLQLSANAADENDFGTPAIRLHGSTYSVAGSRGDVVIVPGDGVAAGEVRIYGTAGTQLLTIGAAVTAAAAVGVPAGTAAAPGITFGTAGAGVYARGAGTVSFSSGSNTIAEVRGNGFCGTFGTISGGFDAGAKWGCIAGEASATQPSLLPSGVFDADTGIGSGTAGLVSIISDGAESVTVGTGYLRQVPVASPPVTCGAGSTQGVEYTDSSGAKCWCDGAAWVVVAGSGDCD